MEASSSAAAAAAALPCGPPAGVALPALAVHTSPHALQERQSTAIASPAANVFSAGAGRAAAASSSFTSQGPAAAADAAAPAAGAAVASSLISHSAAADGAEQGVLSNWSFPRCPTPAAARAARAASTAAAAGAAAPATAAAALRRGVVFLAKAAAVVAAGAGGGALAPSLVAAAATVGEEEGGEATASAGLTGRFAYVDSLHTLLVFALGLAVAACSELLSYFFIYRFEEFQRLQNECRALWKEYYDVEATSGAGADGRPAGRGGRLLEVVEKKIQKKNKQIASYRQKGNLVVGLVVMIAMPTVYACFDDRAAAFLPFHPIFPFNMILRYTPEASSNHAAAEAQADGGADAAANSYAVGDPPPPGATLCSAAGFFMLTVMMTRANLQKFFGFAAPGGSQQQQKLFMLHTS